LTETCTGTGPDCPADAKRTDECRPAAGVCDVAESCDGVSNDCPADGFKPSSTECRAAAGECDVTENCTGSSAMCPTDAKKAAETACTDDGKPCTTDTCDGSNGPGQHPAGNARTVWRAGGRG